MLLPLLVLALSPTPAQTAWNWEAALETPGGPLRFQLAFRQDQKNELRVELVNGEERIEVPSVTLNENETEIVLDMPHYDSRIQARREGGGEWTGTWQKRRGESEIASLPFRAGVGRRPAGDEEGLRPYVGRWRVDFAGEEDDAVAVFAPAPGGRLRGTFLTTTGDYRYLAGEGGAELVLSCFDGAHAFLFRARPLADGSLSGDFWSGDWYHDTWTARRDDAAALPDAFAQTTWNGRTRLADLSFPDLDGTKRQLGDFAGRATLLVVFGSWCPNCNDEAKFLAELDATYRARGLSILGLAFELTGEPARDAEQVRIFARRHELTFPFFLCGTADKDEATKALGLVDRVRAFPTTVFVGADGLPKAIHSGFAGPATGEEHRTLRREFTARIEALLGGK